jgi:hypothetical protein
LDGLSGPELARRTGLQQKQVYRRIYVVLGRLAKGLEDRGFDRTAVRAVTASDGAAIIPPGALDGALRVQTGEIAVL